VDALGAFADGLSVAFEWPNLLAAAIGVTLGSLVGVLPGIGPLTSMALLLPVAFKMDATPSLIMIASVYYGAMYGGSTTSILLGLPGETASVMTAIDGYQLRLQGRAGPALTMAAVGSFVAGIIATAGLVLVAAPLARYALAFGPPEIFALALTGMLLVSVLSFGSVAKGIISAAFGFLLSSVGVDIITGVPRFTFGALEALSGIHIVTVVLGFFAIGEVLFTLLKPPTEHGLPEGNWFNLRLLAPSREDFQVSWLVMLRQSVMGFLLGVLPGAGGGTASFIAYGVEKRLARGERAELFGKGAMEGVVAPETANNAAAQGAFVPMLTLGIPGSAPAAVLMGALIIHGIQPGADLFQNNPDVAWGLIASMLIGNFMLLALNLPLVGIFVQTLRIPFPALALLTVLLSVIGAYSVQNSVFDVVVIFVLGGLSILFRIFGYPLAPLILAVVLGPIIEESLHQSLLISGGDVLAIIARPIPLVIYGSVALITVASIGLRAKRGRQMGHVAVGEDEI
jgi:putative tricarboxylic transport membrane protein